MATLTDSPEYTANEIYEIQQTDPCQGAGDGALFGGLGVQNEPHQQLANRTAFLYGRQNTNIANIGILQAFAALFTGKMGQNGYLKIPFTDISLGATVLVAQWGWYSWYNLTASQVENALFTFAWPIAFPTACLHFQATLTTNDTSGAGALYEAALALEVATPYGKTQGQVFSDFNNQSGAAIAVATGAPPPGAAGSPGLTGFSWLAIGY